MFACRAPRQQQDRDVTAANQQEQRNRPQQQIERRPYLSQEPVVETLYFDPKPLVRKMLWRLLRELLKQRFELCVDGRVADSGLQLDFDVVSSRRIGGDL